MISTGGYAGYVVFGLTYAKPARNSRAPNLQPALTRKIARAHP